MEEQPKKDPYQLRLLNHKGVKQFIHALAPRITQIENTFYTALEFKVQRLIKAAIANNCSRKRITQYEILGTEEK